MNGARSTGLPPLTAPPAERVTAGWPWAPAARVGHLMQADVPSVQRTDRLAAAAALMHGRRVHALAVVDGDRVAGVISESDVLRAVAEGFSTDLLSVADYMSPAPGTLDAEDEALAAAQRMIEHGVRHLPVLRAGRVAGVISAPDLLVGLGVPPKLIRS